MPDDLRLQSVGVEIQIRQEKVDSLAITRIISAINAGFQRIDTVQFNKDLADLGVTRTGAFSVPSLYHPYVGRGKIQ